MANVIKHKRGTSKPSSSDLAVGEIGIDTELAKLFTENDSGYVWEAGELLGSFSGSTIAYTVTVASKTSAHRYNGTGSSLGYKINGVFAPFLSLTPGNTYKFDTSDSSNSNHPFKFYLEAAKTTLYSTGVTINGTAGQSGSYTQITISDTTPLVLHYQCAYHGYMGNSVLTNSKTVNYNDLTNKPTIPSNNNQLTNGAGYITSYVNTQLSTEQVQDIVGAMFSGNTESNISATYEDSDGTIDLSSLNTTYSVGDNGLTQNNFTTTLKNKLDGIEASAEVNPTNAETKTAYEANSDTNAFTDALLNKLNGIDTGAKDDQTAAEIKTLLNSDGIVNAQINASAAIAGSKISPDFGSQNIATTGTTNLGNDVNITGATPHLNFVDSGENPDFQIGNINGGLRFQDTTNSAARMLINADGHIDIAGNLDVGAGIDVTGSISVSGTVDGVDIAARNTLFGGLTSSSGVLSNGVTATTQSASDNSTKVATTAYTDTAISNLINGAPSALDTLNELAAAMNDDAAFSTTVTNSLATKMPLAGGEFTGNITFSGSQTVDGRDLSADGSKLDGIESGAAADQTDAEIRALVASATDSNVFTNALSSKLTGIAAFATNVTNNNQITNGAGYITSSGTSAACSGNAATATALANARTIAGVSFDGSANISLNNNAITNGAGYITATLTSEQVQDIVGAMVSSNSETNISVTYDDSNGKLDFSSTDTNTTYSVGDGGLSQKNFTTALKNKLDGIAAGATNVTNNNQISNGAGYVTTNTTYSVGDGGLTQKNFTTALKNKLDGIAASATNVTNNNQLTNGAGYVTTNTTYSVGDGGLTQKNFTTALKNKLDGIAASANNITNNNQLSNGAGYVTSSGNTIIGTDSDIDTSGATIIDNLYMTDGVITSHGTRTLTLANLGFSGASNANYITNNNQLSNGAGYITSANGGNAATLDSIDSSQFLRSDTGDTASGDITFSGGAGAITIAAGSDIRSSYGNWTGDTPKIQWHGNHLYLCTSSKFVFRRSDNGSEVATIDNGGNLVASGNVTAYSDARLKTDISTINDALGICGKLRGVSYKWIRDGKASIGVIAQEVEEVIPEVVLTNRETNPSTGETTEIKSVDYGKIVGVLINAIKELNAKVKILEGKN